ncbi:hypothetical protein COCOBI_04-1440 [Coccomyxa sp. Obi]|nr:hypothetical protein COCOBI_04-1440 [Coccomyxa sp. Obi]
MSNVCRSGLSNQSGDSDVDFDSAVNNSSGATTGKQKGFAASGSKAGSEKSGKKGLSKAAAKCKQWICQGGWKNTKKPFKLEVKVIKSELVKEPGNLEEKNVCWYRYPEHAQ